MLIRFSVKNFKSFRDEFVFDLSKINNYAFSDRAIRNNHINKAMVYGFNGIGKSNLGLAMLDITAHLTDYQTSKSDYFPYLNLENDDTCAEFSYEFEFPEGVVNYRYKKTDLETLLWERLSINEKNVIEYNFEDNTGFVALAGGENLQIKSEDNKISRVKFVKSNSILEMKVVENILFKKFTDFVDRMLLFYSLKNNRYIGFKTGVGEGISSDVIHENVKDFQEFLHTLGLKFSLSVSEHDGEKKLMAVYKSKKGKRRVPFFSVASTGTKSLTLFYYWYIKLQNASFVFVDEFDAFYHHELSKQVVKLLLNMYDVQVVFTTHNTDLLTNDLLRPDCYFYMMNHTIKKLSECTEKDLRKAHNLQKMFKAGAFEYE